jgi:hypothetical protein
MIRAAVVLLLGLSSGAVSADRWEQLLAKDPVAEAEKAIAAGDRRHIVLPVCGDQPGEVLPGWRKEDVYQSTGRETPGFVKAMDEGQRPLSCSDFGDDKRQVKFIRAVRYAERYNEQLRVLTKGQR